MAVVTHPCAQHLRSCGISYSGEDPAGGLGLPPTPLPVTDELPVGCQLVSMPVNSKGLIHIPAYV